MTSHSYPLEFDVELGTLAISATLLSSSTHRRVLVEEPISPRPSDSTPPSETVSYTVLSSSYPTWPPDSTLSASPSPPRAPFPAQEHPPPPFTEVPLTASGLTQRQTSYLGGEASPQGSDLMATDNEEDPPFMPPPAYAPTVDTGPEYTRINENPETLARYLFRNGFFFPFFWILGASILISNLNPIPRPGDLASDVKTEAEYAQELGIIRATELKWAWRSLSRSGGREDLS
ncbi:uncharacterized protein EI90DRAFT_2528446 [Cantharellus anzutake]|uniref:uncharacterized protein n=1 Tax=Cantharellus anzutake TaxID=1750568 RepID=UPI0019040968|nr:uncharacterized protein EI90DRAFT_2528446 [Cantharellus anzutake]KAF8337999.1 hypothetical protein EI90DRAFT_2528446 [Cantharellus anzutake]